VCLDHYCTTGGGLVKYKKRDFVWTVKKNRLAPKDLFFGEIGGLVGEGDQKEPETTRNH